MICPTSATRLMPPSTLLSSPYRASVPPLRMIMKPSKVPTGVKIADKENLTEESDAHRVDLGEAGTSRRVLWARAVTTFAFGEGDVVDEGTDLNIIAQRDWVWFLVDRLQLADDGSSTPSTFSDPKALVHHIHLKFWEDLELGKGTLLMRKCLDFDAVLQLGGIQHFDKWERVVQRRWGRMGSVYPLPNLEFPAIGPPESIHSMPPQWNSRACLAFLLTKPRAGADRHKGLHKRVIEERTSEIKLLQDNEAVEWSNFLYEKRKTGLLNIDTLLHTTRLLVKLIIKSGHFPTSLVITDITRDIDVLGRLEDAVFQGGYGDVFKGAYRNQAIAIKRLRPLKQDPSFQLKAFVKEIIILSDLQHPHVVTFLGVAEEVEGLGSSPCMIFPWFQNGSLETYLQRNEPSSDELLEWVAELVRGMLYLHTRLIPLLHGDLRLANVLLDDEKRIRIADFGLSQLVRVTATTTRTLGAEPGDEPVSYKSVATDCWALGCTIYEMYDGRHPYHYIRRGAFIEDWRILDSIRSGKPPALSRPDGINPSRSRMPLRLWDIVCRCWDRVPSLRPDMVELEILLVKDISFLAFSSTGFGSKHLKSFGICQSSSSMDEPLRMQ